MTATPVEFTQRRYRCPTCRKSWANRSRAVRHIADGCIHNPEVQACPTCVHDERGHSSTWQEPGEDPHCVIGVRTDEPYTRHCPHWQAR